MLVYDDYQGLRGNEAPCWLVAISVANRWCIEVAKERLRMLAGEGLQLVEALLMAQLAPGFSSKGDRAARPELPMVGSARCWDSKIV